jgi:hypothetical protein
MKKENLRTVFVNENLIDGIKENGYFHTWGTNSEGSTIGIVEFRERHYALFLPNTN